MCKNSISRRTFLKSSLAVGLLASAGPLLGFEEWLSAAQNVPVQVIPTICEMCGVKCGILAYVKEGRVIKLEGNPNHPLSKGRLCARGNAGIKLLYDPDRLRQPLKAMGEGQFKPISWEEAYREIAEKLNELKVKHGPETLVWTSHPELIAAYEKHFMAAFGSPNYTSHAATCYSSRTVAYETTYGKVPGLDYANVKYYISPGRNLVEGIKNAHVQAIMDAKAKGAKLIVLDPRLSNFAALATEWLPLKPGSDLAFILALMYVVVKDELYDKAFVEANTVGFSELKSEVAKYSPEWAAPITDIPAETITRIAREMAAAKPSAAIDPCWHSTRSMNSMQTMRAAACLNALLGNLGAKGGLSLGSGVKLAKPGELTLLGPSLQKPTAKRFDGAGGEKWPLAKGLGMVQTLPDHIFSEEPYPLKAYFVSHHNPVRSCPNTNRFIESLKKLELMVAIDIQMSDTAYFAQYILPESTYLERFDPVQTEGQVVALRQPAVKPLHDTKGEDEIITELARAAGLGQYFDFTLEQFNDALLAPTGVTHRDLLKQGVIKFDIPKSQGLPELKTASGKIELFSTALQAAGGSPVPRWESPAVAPGANDFQMLHGHVPMHTHTSTQNNAWLNALMPENELWIHPGRALRLGIKTGDLLEVSSEVGKVQIKANVTEGIRPDCVFMAHGFGCLSPLQKLNYKQGASPSILIPTRVEAVSGAAADCEVLVTVRKVG